MELPEVKEWISRADLSSGLESEGRQQVTKPQKSVLEN
jgi:hypothetical protein